MFDESDMKTLNTLAAFTVAAIKAYQAGAGTGLLSAGVLAAAKVSLADGVTHRDAFVALVKDAGQSPGTDTITVDYAHSRPQGAGRRLKRRGRA